MSECWHVTQWWVKQVLWHFRVEPNIDYLKVPLVYLTITQMCVCVCVCKGDKLNLQLYCARGVFEQGDSLRVAHAFSRGPSDTDDAVANLEVTDLTQGKVRCRKELL